MVRCGWLVAACFALWLILAGPAYALGGAAGLEGLTYSALLCLIPGCLVFSLASLDVLAGMQAQLVLVGSLVRMLFVLMGTLALRTMRPELGLREFLIWLVVFYSATLLLETLLVLKKRPAA